MAATLSTSCKGSQEGRSKHEKVDAIAVVGETVISASDLRAKLAEQAPLIRSRYTTLERKKEFVDGLVRFEVLLHEAKRVGLESDPEVKATLDKVLVQQLLMRKQQEAERAGSPGDEALRKYYQEHLAEFVRPARIRISHLFLAAPQGDAQRARVRAEASSVLADIKAKESGPIKLAFGERASARSDDPASRASGGDLGFRTRDELAQVWGAPFADAAMGLKATGELGSVIETEKGFHLIKLTARQEGLEQPFDSVRSKIESRLAVENRARALDEFVAGLKAKAAVKIDEDALAKMDFTQAPPASPATVPAAQ
jgi:peptidyl-prolyl cis-trans isomerase C